jgi:hypothetical protein
VTTTSERCGTNAGYQAHMRDGSPPCAECRDAHRVNHRDWRSTATVPEGKHGTIYAYRVLGCRCPRCRQANRRYQAERRKKLGRR